MQESYDEFGLEYEGMEEPERHCLKKRFGRKLEFTSLIPDELFLSTVIFCVERGSMFHLIGGLEQVHSKPE